MITEPYTIESRKNNLDEITRACSEYGRPLIIDIGCLAPRDDTGIYGKENPLEKRCRAARAFERKGIDIVSALNNHSKGMIYFPSTAHELVANCTESLARLVKTCESHKSIVKVPRFGEKRICSIEKDEKFKELIHDVKMALRPWTEIRKRISNRTIPDGMKPMHREAYEEVKAELEPRLLEILYERGATKDQILERFKQITLGAISLARAERTTVHIATYNALCAGTMIDLYRTIRKETNPPRVKMTLLRNEDEPRNFQFPPQETNGIEYKTPFD